MSFEVTKTIYFSYGHRLMSYDGPCKNLHGHNAKVEITLASETLNGKGMVADFGDIKKKLKRWIDDNWDHRFILCQKDPLFSALKKLDPAVIAVPVNPTAENLAKILYEKAKTLGLPVRSVTFWETESSSAIYKDS